MKPSEVKGARAAPIVASGFSLVEAMVVLAVVGVAGALAFMAYSDKVSAARARSDQQGVMLRIKSEQQRATQKLLPVALTPADGGIRVVRAIIPEAVQEAHRKGEALIVGTGMVLCQAGSEELGPLIRFAEAAPVSERSLCLFEDGRPVPGHDQLIIGATDGTAVVLQVGLTGDWSEQTRQLIDDELAMFEKDRKAGVPPPPKG